MGLGGALSEMEQLFNAMTVCTTRNQIVTVKTCKGVIQFSPVQVEGGKTAAIVQVVKE